MAWEYLKFFHIVAVFVLISGIAMIQVSAFKARRTDDVSAFGIYLSLSKTGGMLTAMAVLGAGVFGILTAWQQHVPLTGTRWLEISYLITIIGAILPPFTLKRWGDEAGKLMPQAIEQGSVLPEQRELIAVRRYMMVDTLMNTLLVIIVVLMVFKPTFG